MYKLGCKSNQDLFFKYCRNSNKFKSLIWCIDSPGLGGSELDFIDRGEYLVGDNDIFILGENVDVDFLSSIKKFNGLIIHKKAGNDWKSFFSSLSFFLKTARKYKKSTFAIWAHHPDSNRWLQFFLAMFKYKFIVVERALPANNSFLKKSKLTRPIKRFILKRATKTVICAYSHKGRQQQRNFPGKENLFGNFSEIPFLFVERVRATFSVNPSVMSVSVFASTASKNDVLSVQAFLLPCHKATTEHVCPAVPPSLPAPMPQNHNKACILCCPSKPSSSHATKPQQSVYGLLSVEAKLLQTRLSHVACLRPETENRSL